MINTCTITDWVRLKATLIALHNTRFLCQSCLKKYPKDKKKQATEQRIKGCFECGARVLHVAEKIKFSTCIGNLYSHTAAQWFDAHSHFERGVMPFPGSFTEQPAKVIEVMQTIGDYKLQWELERQRAQALKRKGGSRGRQ